MKLEDEGDEILSVDTCTEFDDVLLTCAGGQCIRFPVTDVRVFAGRNSIGVRGINLADGDKVISMAILHHVDADAAERSAYLKRSIAERRAQGADDADDIVVVGEEVGNETELNDERYQELKAREQTVLTVSEYGYGKRSSSYEFRVSGRGGKGIRATDTSKTDEIGSSSPCSRSRQATRFCSFRTADSLSVCRLTESALPDVPPRASRSSTRRTAKRSFRSNAYPKRIAMKKTAVRAMRRRKVKHRSRTPKNNREARLIWLFVPINEKGRWREPSAFFRCQDWRNWRSRKLFDSSSNAFA